MRHIEREAATIVNGLVEAAKSGSYLHAKFLFDFAGMSSATAPAPEGESLASLLLRKLRGDAPQRPSAPLPGAKPERGLE